MALRNLRYMKLNPLPVDQFPGGYESLKWKERLRDANRELSRAVLDMVNAARDAGASSMAEPTEEMIVLALDNFKAILAGADILDMTEETRFDPDPQADYAVIDDTLGLLTSQYLASDNPEVQAAARNFINRVYELISTRRAPVRASLRSLGVSPSKKPAAPKKPAKPSKKDLKAEIEAELDAEDEGFDFGDEEEEEEAAPPPKAAPKKRKESKAELERRAAELEAQRQALLREEAKASRTVSRAEEKVTMEVGGYANYMVPRRVRMPGQPSDALLAATKGDLLVFRMPDNTAQLWIKNALTYTFKSTQGRSAAKTAALFANEWRKSGKKSRLSCRIVMGEVGSSDFIVVAESLDEITKQAPKKQTPFATEVEDIKRMKLKNPRSNGWRDWFSSAKAAGAKGAAATSLAARRAAHDAQILATKSQLAAARERYRQAYNLLDLTYAEIVEAAERRNKRAVDAEYELIAHVTGMNEGWKPNRTFSLSRADRFKAGYFALEDKLAKLQQTRPNPRRNRR